MKYHKIRGVDKFVCTCEQMIAYNVAFTYTHKYRETWRKTKDQYMRFQQLEFINEAVQWCMKFVKDNEEVCKKYDIDAIWCALCNGLENYWNGNTILWSYEDIGKIFPAPYLNESTIKKAMQWGRIDAFNMAMDMYEHGEIPLDKISETTETLWAEMQKENAE